MGRARGAAAEPARHGEVVWLEPIPDPLLEDVVDAPLGPEARYEQTESISLAFVTALQLLPPRQLAVLILRDVLGFPAGEVAGMLESSVDAVKRAPSNGRAPACSGPPPTAANRRPRPDPLRRRRSRPGSSARGSPSDIDALVALLTEDVVMSMPPTPFEYEGLDVVTRFCAGIFGADRGFDLVPTRANGQPAFGAYLRDASGLSHGVGLFVLTLSGDRIVAMTRFENGVLPSFGLPRSLPRPSGDADRRGPQRL